MGTPDMKNEIYPRLISRDPHEAFTAGQWMTEVRSFSSSIRAGTLPDTFNLYPASRRL